MRRALLLGALLVVFGCGTSRQLPDAGAFDGGIGAPELSVISTAVGFAPATVTQDFAGHFVCADAELPVLHVIDGDTFVPVDLVGVGDAGAWLSPRLSVGQGGQAFLAAQQSDGGPLDAYAVDLGSDEVTPFAQLAGSVGFHARRDASGLVDSDGGAVQVLGEDGGTRASYAAPAGESVTDLASAPDGRLYAVLASGGACTALVRLDADAGVQQPFGASPCVLALDKDAATLWLAAGSDGGAELYQLDAHGLSTLGHWSVDGVSPAQLVLAEDGSRVALLGTGSSTVAVARTNQLSLPAPFKTVTAAQLKSAADAVFDDSGTLYVANPLNQSVDQVR